MLQASLHPAPVTAACERRSRFAFGLTVRALLLLGAGFLWLVPGYFVPRLAYGMLVWDGLILLAALMDGLRLPRPAALTVGRTWLSAPSLGTTVEVELSIQHTGRTVLD